MKKRQIAESKRSAAAIAITATLLLFVFLFLLYTSLSHTPPQINLPPENDSSTAAPFVPDAAAESAVRVEVNTESVQRVIATLSRPDAYLRTVTLTTYWSGGSGKVTVDTFIHGDLARFDAHLPDGQIRHTLRTKTRTYIWYNNETAVHTVQTGAFSEDDDLWIPTYEELLRIDPALLQDAGYETHNDIDCIYASTRQGGYAQTYWIGVESGLLIAAERTQNGSAVYSMEASDMTAGVPGDDKFTLPDGRSFTTSGTADAQTERHRTTG